MLVLVERNDTYPYKCETCSQLGVARLLLQKGAKPAMQDRNRLKCKFINLYSYLRLQNGYTPLHGHRCCFDRIQGEQEMDSHPCILLLEKDSMTWCHYCWKMVQILQQTCNTTTIA